MGSPLWHAPADFAHWCVVETLAQLQARYGVGENAVRRAIKRMPDEIRAERFAAVKRGRALAGELGRANREAMRSQRPVGVTMTKTGPTTPGHDKRDQRAADEAFEAHYVEVAKRHGWPIVDYLGLEAAA